MYALNVGRMLCKLVSHGTNIRYQSRDVMYPVLKGSGFVKR